MTLKSFAKSSPAERATVGTRVNRSFMGTLHLGHVAACFSRAAPQ
jgi:hypothetical protein